MRTSRFTDSQIMAFLKQNEEGAKVPDLCREHGFSAAQFYKWRSKEDENRRLKKMYAEEKLKADLREEILQKKW